MRKSIITIAILVLFTTLVFSGTASARHWEHKKGEVINNTCPVMGGKVDKDTPYKAEYKGKTIGFCCAGCVEKFEADPEKYMAKLKKKCMIKCPECGAEIDIMKECKKVKMDAMCPIMN